MFRRLLFSYVLVIGAVLLIIAVALPLVLGRLRDQVTFSQLQLAGRLVEVETGRIRRQGGDTVRIGRVLNALAENQDRRLLLIESQDRRVVFDTAPEPNWVGQSLDETGRISGYRSLNSGQSTDELPGQARFVAAEGTRWLLHAQPFGGQGLENELILVIAQEEGNPVSLLGTGFLLPLGFTALVALFLSLLLALVISRSVARPLQQMAGAAEAIAEGQYDQQLPVAGPAEMRQVAQSFNYMAEQVGNSRQVQREFMSNVSHELKTPLTSIAGYSQALMEGVITDDKDRQQAARIIHDEAGRMSRLVQELMDLARIDSGRLALHREPVDLAAMLADVHRNLALRAGEKEVQLTLETSAAPPVQGDRDRLTQVFTNLVANGLAHTPAGGRVHVSLKRPAEDAVQVWVQDSGPGIPPADQSRIFDRFFQVERARGRNRQGEKRFGLGLAITKELVEAHQGRIWVRSEPGKGALFIVHLPVATSESISS